MKDELDVKSKQVLWITNFAAPYRIPLWTEIASKTNLSVALLESPKRLERDGRRGRDWLPSNQTTFAGSSFSYPKTVRLKNSERIYYLLLSRASKLVRNADYVVFGAWESPASWQVLRYARARGLKCIGFYESTLLTQRFKKGLISTLRSYFFRRMDSIVTAGSASTAAVLSMGVPREKIVEGFNAVDNGLFLQVARTPRSTSKGHNYIFVGQLIERKNVAETIRAFNQIASDADRLTIVGSGELEKDLFQLVTNLGIANQVSFKGAIPYASLPSEFAHAHTLVLASREEVWGLVVNEALAAGCHAVISKTVGAASSVRHMSGVIVVENSIESLAAGMKQSKENWRGPINNPEIAKYSIQSLADRFLESFDNASAS